MSHAYNPQPGPAVVERAASGQPHQGKVFVAVHAHLDDIPYFAGGLCAKLIAEGYTGYLVRTTNDEHAGQGSTAHNILANETQHAKMAAALGFRDVFELYYRNDRMADIAKAELRGRLVFLYRFLKADMVISFPADPPPAEHPDHQVTGRAAAEAVSLCGVPNEHWEHLEGGFAARPIREHYFLCTGAGQPFNRVVDIGPHLEKKIDAIAECRVQGGGNLGSQLRARLASEGRKLALLGNDDRTADREYIRQFLLDDYRDFGAPYGLPFAERFYYIDRSMPGPSKVDEYVAQHAQE